MALDIFVSELQFRRQVQALFAGLPSSRLSGSKTYDPPSLAAGASASTTVTVTGAVLGQLAGASFSLDTQGIVLGAVVSAANTVAVTLTNPTAGTLDLGSGALSAFAWVA